MSNEIIMSHYTPGKVTPDRVAEIVAALQAGIYPFPAMEVEHRPTGRSVKIISPAMDELLGMVNYLADEIGIERAARQAREAEILDLRRKLARYEPEACS